jgi:hypothetical protein
MCRPFGFVPYLSLVIVLIVAKTEKVFRGHFYFLGLTSFFFFNGCRSRHHLPRTSTFQAHQHYKLLFFQPTLAVKRVYNELPFRACSPSRRQHKVLASLPSRPCLHASSRKRRIARAGANEGTRPPPASSARFLTKPAPALPSPLESPSGNVFHALRGPQVQSCQGLVWLRKNYHLAAAHN